MNTDAILSSACRTAALSRDPFAAAEALAVEVRFESYSSLKGMYAVIKRSRFIFINQNLHPALQRIVCAHELGHDRLHRSLAAVPLREYTLFDMACRPEFEANLFAAELLLEDSDVLELAADGKTAAGIAAELYSDINLVGIKLDILRHKGYPLSKVDYRGSFL